MHYALNVSSLRTESRLA